MLKKINADREGLNLKNVEVQAYASPDGGYSFNDKLANKRQNTTEGYVKNRSRLPNSIPRISMPTIRLRTGTVSSVSSKPATSRTRT